MRGGHAARRAADRATRTITTGSTRRSPPVLGQIREIEGKQATYIPPDHPTAPSRGAGCVTSQRSPPRSTQSSSNPGASIVTKVNDTAGFPPPYATAGASGEVYFLKSNLSFKAMTRKANWYQDASMVELLDGLSDPASETENALISPCGFTFVCCGRSCPSP